MQRKKDVRKDNGSLTSGVIYGFVASMVSTVLLAMVLATIISGERVGINKTQHFVPFIIFVSVIVGCIISIKVTKEKPAVVSGLVGGIYLFTLVALGVLFFDGGFHNLWMSIISVVFGIVLSCAICIRGKGSGRKRKRAYG